MAGCKIGRFPYMMGKLRRIRVFPFSNLLSVMSVIVANAQRSDVSFLGALSSLLSVPVAHFKL